MNLWIAKLGGVGFSAKNIGEVEKIAARYKTLEHREFTQFKSQHIHFLSFATTQEYGKKKYNSSNDHQLIAFSGLPVAGRSEYHDYRDVNNLKKFIKDYKTANNELLGQYALLQASLDEFECFTDFLGIHKIFYSQLSNGEILVSNSVLCIQCIKGKEINYDFYVNWIAFGEIYGYETEDKNIHTLPEFGHLKWSGSDGLKINMVSSLTTLILPEKSSEHDIHYYIRETVSDFKKSIRYITEFHESVLPLSGGYDSRLILEVFTLFNTSGLECYTYPDNEADVKYAKKIARYYQVNHKVLKPEKNLEEIEANESLFFPGDAFLDYSKVFGFQFREQKKKYSENGLKVLLKGDGAGTHAILRKYSQSNDGNPLEAINLIINKSFVKGILKTDVEQIFWNKMKTYYKKKYIDLVRQSETTHAFASIYYFLERFGNYQSHKLINGYQLNDMYLPYANQNFIKAVFLSPQIKLIKNRKMSLHHLLHKELLGDGTKPIHYVDGIHWEANKFQRIHYRIQKMLKKKILMSDIKYSTAVRDQFFEKNKNTFKEVILSSSTNELWNYFDYDNLRKSFLSDKINSSQRKAIYKIVPLLDKH